MAEERDRGDRMIEFFASGFDIDKLAKVTGLRYMKEIVGYGDYFELNTVFVLEPMK